MVSRRQTVGGVDRNLIPAWPIFGQEGIRRDAIGAECRQKVANEAFHAAQAAGGIGIAGPLLAALIPELMLETGDQTQASLLFQGLERSFEQAAQATSPRLAGHGLDVAK